MAKRRKKSMAIKGAEDPAALARLRSARKKYGGKRFAKMAAAGRKRRAKAR